MPSMRERIRIDDDGVRRLLESSGTVQVASHGPHGWPHLVPMWFSLDEDGLITFTTYATSQKARNLQRDARVTVLVESGDVYDELRGVMIEGEAELIHRRPAPDRAGDGHLRCSARRAAPSDARRSPRSAPWRGAQALRRAHPSTALPQLGSLEALRLTHSWPRAFRVGPVAPEGCGDSGTARWEAVRTFDLSSGSAGRGRILGLQPAPATIAPRFL